MPRPMHSVDEPARPTARRSYFERDGVRLTRVEYTPCYVQGVHEHEFASVTLVMRGDSHERSEHDDHISQACTVLIKPPYAPHSNHYGTRNMASLQIAFTPSVVPAFPLGLDCTHLDGGAPAAAMLALLRATATLPGEALTPYVARALSTVAASLSAKPSRTMPEWLSEISVALTAESESPLSVRSLARDAGLHPVSLARAFRRHHGCSITEFVRRTRIVHASRRIAAGDASLVDIAAETGFADQPHFTRAFRTELGCTPGEFRNMVV